jgi:hypothetical protein
MLFSQLWRLISPDTKHICLRDDEAGLYFHMPKTEKEEIERIAMLRKTTLPVYVHRAVRAQLEKDSLWKQRYAKPKPWYLFWQ